MAKNSVNILFVVSATVGSRVLGLLRDILIFASFGTSALNSAFILAFTLPNLFRRLLGEGALNAALLPTFTEELEKNGKKSAFIFLNQVITRVLIILLIITSTLGLTLFAVGFVPGLNDRWYLGIELGIGLFSSYYTYEFECIKTIYFSCFVTNLAQSFDDYFLRYIWGLFGRIFN